MQQTQKFNERETCNYFICRGHGNGIINGIVCRSEELINAAKR